MTPIDSWRVSLQEVWPRWSRSSFVAESGSQVFGFEASEAHVKPSVTHSFLLLPVSTEVGLSVISSTVALSEWHPDFFHDNNRL